ncbi:hypothetical protein ZYGR_0N04080 [Zygosaccharomyces rouxii]|uniref:Uncharacterized protein n=1 Tax=Zygosaccharomyces rouxii TaxID=4956 RepID=A0A1Q3A069_ZYGRO|nr:hypothetical protein ZYGR_0N04080 [Zygosaccharomyces rouxii]
MTKQTITLVSHSVCGKRKADEAEISPRVSIKVVDDETGTTFHYSNNPPVFWGSNKRNNWRSIVFNPLFKNSTSSAVDDDTKPTKRLHKEEKVVENQIKNSVTASVEKPQQFHLRDGGTVSPIEHGAKDSTITAEANEIKIITAAAPATTITGSEFEEKVHKIRFWCNKRVGAPEKSSTSQGEANRERSSKKHQIRRWLNKEGPETILAQRIKKARYDFSLAAAEAAMVAAVRNRAKKAAKAGAFTAAAVTRVIAAEMCPHASHGSIADAISEACKDVAKTSLVQRAENGDYLRLHGLFHYHYKFRGPDYYKALEPCCYYTMKSDGEPTIHCKMDEPVETFRGSAVANDSPLVLFLKQVAEEGGRTSQNDTDTDTDIDDDVDSHVQTKPRSEIPTVPTRAKDEILPAKKGEQDSKPPHNKQQLDKSPVLSGESDVSTTPKLQLDDFFIIKSGDIGSDVRSQAVPLKPTVKRHKDEDCSYGVDKTSMLTPIKHFLETLDLHPTIDENVNPDAEKGKSLPRTVSKCIWHDKTLEPTSQFRIGSQYLSIRTSSVGMVR